MDEQRFLNACGMRDRGNLKQALAEFSNLSENTEDPIDKAGVVLNLATTLKALGEYDRAGRQLDRARALIGSVENSSFATQRDSRLAQVHAALDFEEADLCRHQGQNDEALSKFNAFLNRHRQTLSSPDFQGLYEVTQARRAFLLADLGRCREALPILEEAQSFEELKERIAFYLGHCYVCAHKYEKAKPLLAEALKLGLPRNLEYRAHYSLGIAYLALGGYAQAKAEFEKTAEIADTAYLQDGQVWRGLEISCRKLGLIDEAERYAQMAKASGA